MAQTVIATSALPEAPLDAAAYFHAEHVPMARGLLSGEAALPAPRQAAELDALAIVFPSAGKEHQGWRLAAIQALAREAAPKRVNGVVGDDQSAIDRTTAWLAEAPGITGQLLAVAAD